MTPLRVAAYLQVGDAARAREQLAGIGRRCDMTCEDYAALAEEIGRHECAGRTQDAGGVVAEGA